MGVDDDDDDDGRGAAEAGAAADDGAANEEEAEEAEEAEEDAADETPATIAAAEDLVLMGDTRSGVGPPGFARLAPLTTEAAVTGPLTELAMGRLRG